MAAEEPAITLLRSLTSVDYPNVWRVKERVLRAAFAALPSIATVAESFSAFIEAGGQALHGFNLRETLVAVHGPEWRTWPADLSAPDASGIAAFASAHASEIRFSAFLQFLAELALQDAAAEARNAGMPIGLYRDLAVGCAPDGAEAWCEQARLLNGASVGAPPDPLGPLGQIWHLPPPDPLAMA